jgi:hypothetical protein
MRAHLLLPGLLALSALGCADPTEPGNYNLRVSVSTVGADRDSTYTVRAGDLAPRPVRFSALLSLPSGEHDVVLQDVAPNCSVMGTDSIRVTITSGDLAIAEFEVECRATTGAIEVTAPTSGRDFDVDGYTVWVDDVVRNRVFSGIVIVIDSVAPGSHVVTLGDLSPNCSLAGPLSRTVQVTAGGLTRDTVRTSFPGSCRATTGDVQLVTTTEGLEPDPDGYTVSVDGEVVVAPCGWYDYYCEPGVPFLFAPNGDHLFFQVAPGDHTYRLGQIGSNCTVRDGDSRTASVEIGEVTEVRFEVSCESSTGGAAAPPVAARRDARAGEAARPPAR